MNYMEKITIKTEAKIADDLSEIFGPTSTAIGYGNISNMRECLVGAISLMEKSPTFTLSSFFQLTISL